MHRPLVASLVSLALVLFASGCGGDERAEYERDLKQVGGIVERSLEAVPRDARAEIGPRQMRALAASLREAADELEGLDPPENVEAAQEQLVGGLRGVATSYEELADALESASTPASRAELFVGFSTDERAEAAFNDLLEAQETYATAGFEVFDAADAADVGQTPGAGAASEAPAAPAADAAAAGDAESAPDAAIEPAP